MGGPGDEETSPLVSDEDEDEPVSKRARETLSRNAESSASLGGGAAATKKSLGTKKGVAREPAAIAAVGEPVTATGSEESAEAKDGDAPEEKGTPAPSPPSHCLTLPTNTIE